MEFPMTRQTNRRLIWMGFLAALAFVPTAFLGAWVSEAFDPTGSLRVYFRIFVVALLVTEIIAFFFCFLIYGWFARIATWMLSPGYSNDLVGRSIKRSSQIYRSLGIWVEQV
jgi:hypothetical protein